MNKDKDIKIIYIMGAPHSGSTLLNIVLGEGKNCLSLGEFQYLFKVIKRKGLCSCLMRLNECNFWRELLNNFFGSNLEKELDYILKIQKKIEKIPIINFLKKDRYFKEIKEELILYKKFLKDFFIFLKDKTKKNIFIDSSKRPTYFFIFKDLPFEFHILHLIRNPKGVVHSYINSKYNKYTKTYRKTHHPFTTIYSWIKVNLQIEIIKRKYKNFYEINLENFLKNPKEFLERISKKIQIDYDLNRIINENQIFLDKKEYHLIGGSEIKYKINNEKIIVLKNTEDWKTMPIQYKIITNFLTFPFLLRYNYF